MKQINNIVQFPCDAQSSPFFGALASALLPALGYTEETPYYCAQKASYCIQCGNFLSYIADNNNETHGVLWKVWGQLGVGPETGYSLLPNVDELVTRPETKAELKRFFSFVFQNDRDVLSVLREALELVQK